MLRSGAANGAGRIVSQEIGRGWFMKRLVIGSLLAAALSGCRTCDNPYDYCGPVIDGHYQGDGETMPGEGPTMGPPAIPSPPPETPTPPRGNASEPTPAGT